ncbi:MAG: class I SAM-dependent methyltransferase [bacterium]
MEQYNNPITNFVKRTWDLIQDKNYQTALLIGENMDEDQAFFAGKGLTITKGDIQQISTLSGRYDLVYLNINFHELSKETLMQAFDHLAKLMNANGSLYARGRSTQDAKIDTGTDRHFQYFTKEELEGCLRSLHVVKIDSTSLIQNDLKSHFLEAIATKSFS